ERLHAVAGLDTFPAAKREIDAANEADRDLVVDDEDAAAGGLPGAGCRAVCGALGEPGVVTAVADLGWAGRTPPAGQGRPRRRRPLSPNHQQGSPWSAP